MLGITMPLNSNNRRRIGKHDMKEPNKCVVALITVFLAIGLATGLIIIWRSGIFTSSDKDMPPNVCYTLDCNKSAALLLNFMNSSADPCEDFYEFACGNYVANTVIPEDKSLTNLFSEVTDIVMEQLRIIVEEPIMEDELAPFKSMKNLYRSCIDTEAINKVGTKPIKDYLPQLGGWPVLEANGWTESTFSWTDTVYKFRKYGYSADYVMDLSVLQDVKNSSTRRIQFNEPVLTLRREYFLKGLDNNVCKEYYNYMVDIATLLGANRTTAEKDMKGALLFEMALSNITITAEDRRTDLNKFYNPMTIEEAEKNFSFIPWLEYINEVLSPVEAVEKSELIVITRLQYLSDLEKILGITPKRVQANYLIWRAIQWSIGYLSEDMKNRQQKFVSVINGITEQLPRWMDCVSLACGSFHIASGSKYIQKYFEDEGKAEALEVVQNIRKAMYNTLKEVDWMDESTRNNALQKAYAMVNHIAYPDELLNSSNIVSLYKPLHIEPGDYYGSILNITRFASDYSFSKLRQFVNKTDWRTHSQADTVNAMYNPVENSIQFPAGILQHIFFCGKRPKYMNYGAIGFVIGHEITHAFDDNGSQFDKDGNLINWWNAETRNRYLEKAKCIVHQYGNYTVEEVGLKINGIVTQGENMADNNGVRTAYIAYNNWAKEHPVEPQLPNLPYTSQQMFWLSAASIWCGKYKTEALKLQIETGTHCPNKVRVIGSFSNQEDFSRDFNCPASSKMNPKNKCRVW